MTGKKHMTLAEAKQVIEDYLMFVGLSIGRLIYIDFSIFSSEKIIKFAESLPQGLINFSKTLDASIEIMEKNIAEAKKQNDKK